eukprot:TRINITY_DN18602_c0_g1_i1.p1 TRINITY_DN18602_c0_g1~~TRINITY_DN18602_c0_g1_i1.p1  ORF type:complete len:306 (-),score=54.21 TRINITY_DN18602_c0_g1_i1:381-1298(-)
MWGDFGQRAAAVLPNLQCLDYETSKLDPAAAPEKQAKVAIDRAIASGSLEQLRGVLSQVEQHLPQETRSLTMHCLRESAKGGSLDMLHFLLEQLKACQPSDLCELLKYALTGAAMQPGPGVLDFLLGAVQRLCPGQLLELLQYAVGAAAGQGNLRLLKFLMDHTAAAAIPINYSVVFNQAISAGKAEDLLRGAIEGGVYYENVIMMLLFALKSIPENVNESQVGSRQSLENAAKLQVVKSYKKTDPVLFERLMAAIKSFLSDVPPSIKDKDSCPPPLRRRSGSNSVDRFGSCSQRSYRSRSRERR